MAELKQLTENGIDIIPVAHEDGVFDDNGISIGHKFRDHIENHPSGGGSSDVTKSYVDSQDKVLDDKITVLSGKVQNHIDNHPSGEGGLSNEQILEINKIPSIENKLNNLTLDDVEGIVNNNQGNLFVAEGCEDFFYDYEGNKVDSANGSVMSNWIECKAGQKITRNGTPTNVVCYFDNNKNFIQRVDSYGFATIIAPNNNNIAYVRMAVVVEEGRKIVYGSKIVNDNEIGNHYTIPMLKIFEKNLDRSLCVMKSPNGKEWIIKVKDDGSLYTEEVSDEVELPLDIVTFTFSGTQTYEGEYYITPHDEVLGKYILIMNGKGKIVWYKQVETWAYNFRKYKNSNGLDRYTYQEVHDDIGVGSNGGHNRCYLIILDENKNEIDRVEKMIENGNVPSNKLPECHDYLYIDDGHYVISGYVSVSTNDWDDKGDNYTVVASILQEIKNNELVWQWDSTQHLDLYNDSQSDSFTGDAGTDYVHFNSIVIDHNDNNFICSFRNMHSILKLNRTTGEIIWKLGGKSDMFNVPSDKIWIGQHDAKIVSSENGIINLTFYDNHTGHQTDGQNLSFVVDATINENTKEIIELKKYSYKKVGAYMGGVTKISSNKDRYLITWGGGNSTITEVDFSSAIPSEILEIKCNEGVDNYRVFRTITSVSEDDEEIAPGEIIIDQGNMIPGAWNASCPPGSVVTTTEMKTENWSIPIQEGKTYTFELIGDGSSDINSNSNAKVYDLSKTKVISNNSLDSRIGNFVNGKITFKIVRSESVSEEIGFFNVRAITGEVKEGWTYKVTQLD